MTKPLPVDGIHLKAAVLSWVSRMRVDDGRYGPFRFSSKAQSPTLLSSCFAALAYELFDALDLVTTQQRMQWAQFICAHQDPETGRFVDPFMGRDGAKHHPFDWDYSTMQFTYMSLAALDALDGQARYPLHFIGPLGRPHTAVEWLESLHMQDFWFESNRIMFVLSFLLNRVQQGDRHAEGAIEAIMLWLDDNQDPQTGYWGTDRGASLFNGMGGAYHIYPYYFYLGRGAKYVRKIIDSTLALHQSDGLFNPGLGGGACADMDAIDILVKFSLVDDYRAADVKRTLTSAFESILSRHNRDGGFAEVLGPRRKSLKRRVAEAFLVDKLLRKRLPPETYCHNRWPKMACLATDSNMLASWFRPLALALISSRYPGEFITGVEWRFRRVPCLGWHDAAQINGDSPH